MNKILLTIAAVMLVTIGTFAQTPTLLPTPAPTNKVGYNKIRLGFKLGANYANVYDSKTDGFSADGKYGFVAGSFLTIPITEYFGFQPEVLYSQKGFIGRGIIHGSNYAITRTTNFIDVPLLFAVKPFGPYFELVGGPQYSFLLKQSDVLETTATNISSTQDFNNDNIRKNILGVLVGFSITAEKVRFGVRAGWDLQNNNGDATSSEPRYKNVWYQTTIGFVL